MASKRTVQLFANRANASILGRQTSRLSIKAVRAFSYAARKESVGNPTRRNLNIRRPSEVQELYEQKRWNSRDAGSPQGKVYTYSDVRPPSLFFHLRISPPLPSLFHTKPYHFRSWTFSKHPRTHASSSTPANPASSRRILFQPRLISR